MRDSCLDLVLSAGNRYECGAVRVVFVWKQCDVHGVGSAFVPAFGRYGEPFGNAFLARLGYCSLPGILGDEVDSGFPFGAFGRDGLYELRGVRYADLSVEQRLQLFASGQ